jgi:D-alanyl-D-alanine carboxypeptidase
VAPAEAAPAEALVSEAAPAAVVPDAAVADAVQDAIDAGLRDAFAGRAVPQPRARPATLAAALAAAEPPPAPPPAAPSVTPADGAAEIVAAVAAALAEDASATIAEAAASVSPMRPAPRKLAADLVAADPAPAGPGAADLAAADLAAADLAAADPAAAEPLPSVAVGAADADAIALAASGPGGAPAGIEDLPLLGEDAADVPPAVAAVMPIVRPDPAADAGAIILTAGTDPAAASALAGQGQAGDAAAEVAVRLSTSGGRYWGITLGRFPSRGTAERALLQTGLSEAETLGTALRKVVPRGAGYEATFHGLSREEADLACRRLAARGTACFAVGP